MSLSKGWLWYGDVGFAAWYGSAQIQYSDEAGSSLPAFHVNSVRTAAKGLAALIGKCQIGI